MKNQIFFQISQSASAYLYSSSFELIEGQKVGQVCGQIAHRINQRFALTKASGNGKGLSLRKDFDLCVSIDGQTLFDTATIEADIKRRILGGLSERSQTRFAQAIALCIYAAKLDEVTEHANKELAKNDTFTIEDTFTAVRFTMDCPAVELL